ncbi:MAG: hypothetical protein IKM73_13415 [Acidaminococcaceae bacterium]|nr:hypothetical protein [Acidaminococcaceae bacterium]
MVLTPFRELFTLVILDGNFYLSQNLLAGLTDRRAEGGDGSRGVEVKDVQKILVGEIPFRLQPAAGQQGVGGTDDGGVSERCSDVEIIIFFQEGPVNDAEDVILIVVPILVHKLRGDGFQLFRKAVVG